MVELIVTLIFVLCIGGILGVISFILQLNASGELRALQGRLQTLEAEYALLRGGAPFAPPPAAPDEREQPAAPEAPDEAPPPASAMAPEQSAGLEERLGSRWAVWVGGVALALGGLFLVKYAFDQGWIGPEVRIFLGAALAAALIAAGEWMRRSEAPMTDIAIPSAHIPSALTAAGTVTAFGTIYAAHALYGFIGPAAAFILLGAAAIGTLAASLLHGPALAGLGLAGSFATPILVASPKPDAWPVVLFLAVVGAAALLLARLRSWLWLAQTAVAGACVWGLLLSITDNAADPWWMSAAMAHIALQTALAGLVLAIMTHAGAADAEARLDSISTIALGVLSLTAVTALASDQTAPSGWVPFAAAMMAFLAISGERAPPAAAALGFAGLIAVAALWMWPYEVLPPPIAEGVAAETPQPPQIAALPLYLGFGALSLAALNWLAGLRLLRGPELPLTLAGLYAAAATVPQLLGLIAAYQRVTEFTHSIPFALGAGLLALGFTLAAQRFDREGPLAPPAIRLGLGAYAAAAVAAFAFALICFLERAYLTVALALAALGSAYVASVKDIPSLRIAVAALGLAVLSRMIWDPRIMGDDVGAMPIFNWLLFGYGVPALAFAAAANLLRPSRDDLAVQICDALAILFAWLLVFFQIRHALNAGDPLADASSHLEQGLFTLSSLIFAAALTRLNAARANPVFRIATLILGAAAIVTGAMGLALSRNPYWSGEPVLGGPVFSSLFLAYAVPAAAAVVLARQSIGRQPEWYRQGAVILAVGLMFAYLTLEVRHLFQGENISFWQGSSGAEEWSYSLAWLTFGLSLLAYGVIRQSREARLASAALVVLTVLKVFLIDMAGLQGIWRALSFIALGFVLIGIGYVYQKLIFPGNRASAAPAT